MEIRDWIIIAFGIFGLMIWMNKNYQSNYYFQGFWLILGNWFYVAMFAVFEEISFAFPILMIVMNTVVNIFSIARALDKQKQRKDEKL